MCSVCFLWVSSVACDANVSPNFSIIAICASRRQTGADAYDPVDHTIGGDGLRDLRPGVELKGRPIKRFGENAVGVRFKYRELGIAESGRWVFPVCESLIQRVHELRR